MAYKPLKLLAKLASKLAYSGRRYKSRQRLFSLAQQHPAWPRTEQPLMTGQ